MKKNYFALLYLLIVVSSSIKAQNSLNDSKYYSQIKEYLSVNYQFTSEDISNLYISSEYSSKQTQITHVYVGQQYQGVEVFNAISSIAIKDNQVFYVGNSFIPNMVEKINATSPIISQLKAVNTVAKRFKTNKVLELNEIESNHIKQKYLYDKGDLFLENIPVQLVYTVTDKETLRLSWDVSLYTLDGKHNWNAKVDALTGEILETRDYVISCDFGVPHLHEINEKNKCQGTDLGINLFKKSENSIVGGAEYRVYQLPVESPNHGGRTLVVDPENTVASPFGWHDTNGVLGAEYTITRGNNVHAYNDIGADNTSDGDEPDGGAVLSFDYPTNLSMHPSTSNATVKNLEGHTTNLFYMNNMMHDIWYAYGFDEAAGNFQDNNYGNGGVGGDYVLAEAQDGGGTNNANFSTPTDGGNGRMQMYLWTTANPRKDGDLDNGIVAHEYGHGISTRLAGGPNSSGCLSGSEQQGEGWSDWFALMITIEPGDLGTDGRGIGTYAINQGVNGGGIRTYRYSTNTAINPHTYDDIKTEAVPHGVGSVWCAMLWDLTWAYIDKYGFDPDLYNGTGGNNKVMQLVMDGLKLQPCGSGFVDSRDAILAADIALTGGVDQCLIWEVFAARGLGASADQGSSASNTDGTEAFDMPQATINANVTTNDACGSSLVELTFSNFDTNAISQFEYSYTIDGGAPINDVYTNSIASCSVANGIPFNYGSLSPGTHEITITGTNPIANSKTFLVHVNDTGVYDVVNTFEAAADNLIAYNQAGSTATWQRGTASGTTLNNTVANNSTVYGTTLGGLHGDMDKFFLVSRCYDLSALENTFVEFDMAFDIEQDWDLLYMEYSTDGGSNWSVLGTTNPTWYNSTRLPNGSDCFNCIGRQWTGEAGDATSHPDGGINGAMHHYSYPLNAFDSTGSAETSIVFRFTYHADEAYAEEGVIIDNFVVTGDVNPLSVEENEFDKLMMYPNPTNGVVTITSTETLNNAKVSVYDVMGRNLTNTIRVSKIDNNSITVNINEFAAGTYVITIEDEKRKSVKQIVKY